MTARGFVCTNREVSMEREWGEGRDARVVLRVKESESKRWKAAAKRAGKTLAAWLRDLANEAAPPPTRRKR